MPRITAQQYREFRAWKPKLLTKAFSNVNGVTDPIEPSVSAMSTAHRALPAWQSHETAPTQNLQDSEAELISNYANSYEIISRSSHPGLNPNYHFDIQRSNPYARLEAFTPISLSDIFEQMQAQTNDATTRLERHLKIGGLSFKPMVNALLIQEYQRVSAVLQATQQHLKAVQQQALQAQQQFEANLNAKEEQVKQAQLERAALSKHQVHLRDQLVQLKKLQHELDASALRYQRLQHEYQVLTDRHVRQTDDLRKISGRVKTQDSDVDILKKQLKHVYHQVHELTQALQAAEKNMMLMDNKYQLERKLRLSQETEIKDLLSRLKTAQAIADMEKTLRQKSDQRADFAVKTRQVTEEQLFQAFANQSQISQKSN